MPLKIQHATQDYEKFLEVAGDQVHLTTRNKTYTMVEAVFTVFRRRLETTQIIAFANLLPPVLGYIFINDYDADEIVAMFSARENLINEVQLFRKNHSFSPDHAIEAVAFALWQQVDHSAFNEFLHALDGDAVSYWQLP